jgi:arylsulfatase A-like enzyme
MRAVIVMFDSLNRHLLPPYGCTWTRTPNFDRLNRRATRFEQSYVCSMPCMPARRDLHTGRPNFLHTPWCPLQPFDDSMPQLLREHGVHTHLSTDHQHYWEDGGCTYHPRYSTFDLIRGQEGDPWVGQVNPPPPPEQVIPRPGELSRQDFINRQRFRSVADLPMSQTFRQGLDFIERNHRDDRWLVQIETFDPHEPFFTLKEQRQAYASHFDRYGGKPFEWPPYAPVRETAADIEHCRHEYAALVSACDARLGEVLDTFDRLDLWRDTLLVVWTDHGFMLGEHESWGKCWLPFYQEIAHTPFWMWDPRSPAAAGQSRRALVQPAIDLAPTLLRFFGLDPTPDMLGHDLATVVAADTAVRQHAIFGLFGHQVNITDGRYIYMRGPRDPANQPLFEYTLMPTRMRSRFTPDELNRDLTLAPPFSFTKQCPVLRRAVAEPLDAPHRCADLARTLLFDLAADPGERQPLAAPAVEARLAAALAAEMKRCDAPLEQYQRLGLDCPSS